MTISIFPSFSIAVLVCQKAPSLSALTCPPCSCGSFSQSTIRQRPCSCKRIRNLGRSGYLCCLAVLGDDHNHLPYKMGPPR